MGTREGSRVLRVGEHLAHAAAGTYRDEVVEISLTVLDAEDHPCIDAACRVRLAVMVDRDVSTTPSPLPAPPRQPVGSVAGVAPAEDDDDLPATAWRSRKALERTRKHDARITAIEDELGRRPNPDDEDDEGDGILGRLSVMEVTVGRPEDPIKKRPATGIIGGFLKLEAALEGLTTELRADREGRERQWAILSKLAWGLGLPVGVAAVLAAGTVAVRWLTTLHH